MMYLISKKGNLVLKMSMVNMISYPLEISVSPPPPSVHLVPPCLILHGRNMIAMSFASIHFTFRCHNNTSLNAGLINVSRVYYFMTSVYCDDVRLCDFLDLRQLVLSLP